MDARPVLSLVIWTILEAIQQCTYAEIFKNKLKLNRILDIYTKAICLQVGDLLIFLLSDDIRKYCQCPFLCDIIVRIIRI